MSGGKSTLAASIVHRIARCASVDPRTVRKFLAGEPVRGLAGDRIEAELKQRGLPLPPPAPGKAP